MENINAVQTTQESKTMSSLTREQAVAIVGILRGLAPEAEVDCYARDHAVRDANDAYTGEIVTLRRVTIKLQDTRTGNGTMREISDPINESESMALVAAMRQEIKTRAKATRRAIAAENRMT
jgi:hypothetical protein